MKITGPHNCIENLNPDRGKMVFDGRKVYIHGECEICGEEFEIEYDLIEVRPG